MFSLSAIVLVLVGLAASAPSPGIYHGGLAVPAATSYSSRVDIHTPVVKTAIVSPLVSSAYSYSPYVSSYGYGLHDYGHGLGYGGYGLGHEYGLGHGYGSLGGLGHYGYSTYGHGW